MEKYVITTENTADLPYSYYKEHRVEYMYLTYQLDGITYNKENELDFKAFYSRMRAGSMPTNPRSTVRKRKTFCDRFWRPEMMYCIWHFLPG